MKTELLKMMDRDEIAGLAEAFRIDTENLTFDEVCELVARKLRED